MDDETRFRNLFALSADFGAMLQTRTDNPRDAAIVLLMTLGRLTAREGSSDLRSDSLEWFTQTDVIEAYKAGFDQERAAGHKGRPPKAN